MTQSPSTLRAYVLLTGTTACWGANAVFGRIAVGEISPMLLVSLRWLGVVFLLSVFAFGGVVKEWAKLKENWLFLSVMGILGFTAFNALFYVAAHSTTALNIGIIQGSMPIFIAIGAFLAYRTSVGLTQILGILVTVVGVCLVVSTASLEKLLSLTFNRGDLIMLIACLLYSGYAVGLKRVPDVSSLSLFTVLATAALAASVPLTMIEYSQGYLQWPTVKGWGIVLLVTLFPSFFAQIFFIQGVSIIGPGRAGIFVNLIPIFAAIFAVFFLRESFELYHAVALMLVLGGIGLSELRKTSG